MPLYAIKIVILLILSLFVGYNFYFIFPWHFANFDWYFPYIFTTLIVFWIYKYLQLHSSEKSKEIKISFYSLLSLFLTNLFVLSFFYFSIISSPAGQGITLFFKIIGFSLLPLSIFLSATSFWKTITDKFLDKKEITNPWLLDLGMWFASFISLITIFWIFWFYNIYIVLILLLAFAWISYKNIIYYIKKITSYEYVFDKDTWSQIRLAIGEFFVFVAFVALWIGLISIVRPYPIGWDDLGVYMNYPHLIAQAGELFPLGFMYSWQIFTWIWYLFNSPTQAFFLNVSWLFLSFFALNTILSSLLKSEKKTILPLPIILSTIFIALPMVVFQSTKDMKVDEWLFFLSITALYYVYTYFSKLKEKSDKNSSLLLLFFIWIIVGFCFSIKFTTILLIIWIIALISYARLWISWMLWYIGLFLWIFTIWNLWGLMQVNINPYNIEWLELRSGVVLLWLGFISLIFSFFKNKKIIIPYIKEVLIFVLWVFVVLVPWLWKNLYDIYPNISVGSLVTWWNSSFIPDYKKIYSDTELEKINTELRKDSVKEGLSTTNEDLLRYIWYENWILKYVNMFWNLTMQKNQSWEYTNIWFIFFAFLPLIFIFLPYRNRYYFVFFIFIWLSQLLYYSAPTSNYISESQIKNVDSDVIQKLLTEDNNIFKDKPFNKDIYDINIKNYYSKEDLWQSIAQMDETLQRAKELYNTETSKVKKSESYYLDKAISEKYSSFESSLNTSFYSILKEMVKNPSIWPELQVFEAPLNKEDYEYVKYLNLKYLSNKKLDATDIVEFKNKLDSNNVTWKNREELLKIWDESRTFIGKINDILAKTKLPVGYIYLFLGFLIPTLYLLKTLKDTELNYIFRLNLVFASLYVFLWFISSFGIVWYWIAMYFSFLLMIWIGLYNISSYKELNDNKYYTKLAGSIVVLIIILFYIFYSTLPYLFNNLKNSWFNLYKSWNLSSVESVFVSQWDYANILFELNIKEDKRKDFILKNVNKELVDWFKITWDEKISYIISSLRDLKNNQNIKIRQEANKSLNNIYDWILNPKEEFKNDWKVYRAGTFLKYYISDNNSRLLEDNLITEYDYYLNSDNVEKTVDNLKKIWIKYILIDLNTATIDNSSTHDLTNRYEKLLSNLVSNKLELVSTDSMCLQIGDELYKKNWDAAEFLKYATVNHNSYEWDNLISASSKRELCANKLNEIIENNMINENSYAFLLSVKSTLESFKWDVTTLNKVIWTSYKALYKIK